MSGLLAELKRRNVIRVAGLYLVGAWLLTQVAGTVLPMFGAPDWLPRSVVILLALGFVPALIVAWVFELTPQGLRRDDEVKPDESIAPQTARRMDRMIIVVLIIALVYFGIDKFVLAPRREAAIVASVQKADTSPGVAKPGDTPSDRSIAVLPFENLSADKDNEYFASGMQDMILTKLADIRELKVISRTSTEKYKSHPDNLKTIAGELGVARIVEGSVQKAGNQVLINVQLIDVATDQHLWAQAYTRTLDNIFGVEGEVAGMIAEALKAKLSPAEAKAVAKVGTQNKEALDLLLRARYFLGNANRTLDKANLDQCIALAQQASTIDPRYPDAFSTLSLCYLKLGGHDREAEDSARHSLAIDPDHALGHLRLGLALHKRGLIDEPIAEAREAVRLQPGGASNQNGLGILLAYAGRFEEAAASYQRALEIDPASTFVRSGLAMVHAQRRDYGVARDLLRGAVARDPADLLATAYLVSVHLLGWGDVEAARAVLRTVPTAVASSGALSYVWYSVHLIERDYPAALAVIGQVPAGWFEGEKMPRQLLQARAYELQGDSTHAREAYAAARAQLERWLTDQPDDPSLHHRLAQALAGGGEYAAATREAQRALELRPLAIDMLHGPEVLVTQADVHARAGRTRDAVALLRKLLDMPAGGDVSVPLLKLDPSWDPIRKDPGFEALLVESSNTVKSGG